MSLQADFFNLIACGKKTIEIRLNDEKRMKVKSGDIIKFSNLSNHEELEVDVINITRYESFEEMYFKINIQNLGLGEITLDEFKSLVYKIYSPKKEKELGVLALSISLKNNQ